MAALAAAGRGGGTGGMESVTRAEEVDHETMPSRRTLVTTAQWFAGAVEQFPLLDLDEAWVAASRTIP